MPSLSAARAHRSLGWSLALLAFAQLIYSLDINIVFVALPEIGAGLGFSEQTLQWVVSAYTVFCGGFLLLGGRAVDLLGQRRMFIGALWLYALSSLVGGLAWNPAVIVIARAVQGIGAALLFPSTLSLINRLFEEGPPRNRALAIWGGAGASGLTLGSLAGGVLTSAYGWPSVFFVNVLLAGIAIVAAFLVIPRTPRAPQLRHAGRADGDGGGHAAGLCPGAGAGGRLAGHAHLRVARAGRRVPTGLRGDRVAQPRPLMPMRLFGNGSLVVGMILTFIFMGTFGALPYFLTLLFQNVQGYSALQTGLAFIVPSLAIFFGTQLGARLANRMSARSTLVAGFVTGIAGTLALASAAFVGAPYALILPGLVVSGIGQGIVWTAMWIVAASGVAHHEQGIASGMASTTLNVGNAIGIAVLVAYANRGIGGLHGDALRAGLAAGAQHAFYLAAAGLVLGLLVSLAFSPRAGAGARVGAA